MFPQDQHLAKRPRGINQAARPSGESATLLNIFIVLFAQLFLLILVSFVTQSGLLFVERLFLFGLDYHDFYVGTLDWIHHADPYLRNRMYTPPSSIVVGLALVWLPFNLSAIIFALVNLALIYISIRALVSYFHLSESDQLTLFGIAAVFYPVYFLLERGNLDGVVFALLVFGFRTENWFQRSLLLGASVAFKVYPCLLLLILLRRRRNWKVVIGSGLVFAAMQLPFLNLFPSFVSAIMFRSGYFRFDQNISPAAIIWVFAGRSGLWKLVFVAIWTVTLLYRALRHRNEDISRAWPVYVPWMISLPAVVYPYSGILSLALAALIARECYSRMPTIFESLALVGISLLGFQAVAWSTVLHLQQDFLHGVCALGTLLMLIGAWGLPSYGGEEKTTGFLMTPPSAPEDLTNLANCIQSADRQRAAR